MNKIITFVCIVIFYVSFSKEVSGNALGRLPAGPSVEVYEKTDAAWKAYKIKFNKAYKSPVEETEKRKEWEKNTDYVNKNNKDYLAKKTTLVLAVNEFSDGTKGATGSILINPQAPSNNNSLGRLPASEGVEIYETNDLAWNDFKKKFNKAYKTPVEEAKNREEWVKSVNAVNKHNQNYLNGKTYSLWQVDQFSDLSEPSFGRRTTTPHPYKNGRMTAQYVEYYQTGDDAWDEYKRKYNKNYKPSDEKEKRKVWEKSSQDVNDNNQKYLNGQSSLVMGINQFSDGTPVATGGKTAELVEVYKTDNDSWNNYKKKYSKNYDEKEEKEKRKHWEKSVAAINNHNEQFLKGKEKIILHLNRYSDGSKPEKGFIKTKNVRFYQNTDAAWAVYKTEYNKVYKTSTEEAEKRKAWAKTIEEVNKNNLEFIRGKSTHEMKVNEFADGTKGATGLIKIDPERDHVAVYETHDKAWEDYKKAFNKKYLPAEEPEKRKLWAKTSEEVNKHNLEYLKGKETSLQGVNQFADGTVPAKGRLSAESSYALGRNKPGPSVEVFGVTDKDWEEYKKKFNKKYKNSTEEAERRKMWNKNTKDVNTHNSEYIDGKHTSTQGVNQFSDGTEPGKGLLLPVINPVG